MPKRPDYYVTLGISRNATQEEIKQAYIKAAQRLHPDKNQEVGETEIFLDVQQAYETLSNPKSRKKYDGSLPAEEKPSLPISYCVQYSRPYLVHLDEYQVIYVLLNISPEKELEELPPPPLNIALVLDRSTSMTGEKMDVLKNSAIEIMQKMRPQDIFSVVTFSDRAEVIIPASTQSDLRKLESKIRMLQPSGATEIFQGLKAAWTEVKRNASKGRIDHIILLTDGHTYGDVENCYNLAKKVAAQRVGISTMGIGEEWNDEFLDTLANHTGGGSRYVSRTSDINKFLIAKLDSLARTLADDVILEFKLSPGVEMAYAFRTQPETVPLPTHESIHLGPVLKDTALKILFEFQIEPSISKYKSIDLLLGKLQLSIVALPTPLQPLELKFSREVKEEPGSAPTSADIIQALGKLTMYRMQEKARNEIQNGQYEIAAKHMKQLATNLLTQGEHGLARTALIEAENIEKLKTFSEEGSKAIKYGTRSLMMSHNKEQTR